MKYPLASTTWDDAEYSAIERVIKSGMFSMGTEVSTFEKQFAEWTGSQYAVMVNSGSSANLLMIAALMFRKENPLQRGDEVIVPAISWSTTYHPLQQHGLVLKFVDVDAETLNIDTNQLASAISEKTRAILTVNLLGNPNDFKAIKTIVGQRDIILLEDNCESMGAVFDSKKTGTHGLMGTFSSFFSHHISTMEGGLVVTDDEEMYHLLLCMRAHGWTRNLPKHNQVCSTKSDDPFEESFRFVLPGYNLRPLEMSGAIGQEQLKKLDAMIQSRRNNAAYFTESISRISCVQAQKEIGLSSWFGFSIVLAPDSQISRKKVVRHLQQKNIDVRPIVAGNFTKNEALKWFDYSIHNTLTNADRVDQQGFFVGNHHFDIREEIDYLAQELQSSLKSSTQ